MTLSGDTPTVKTLVLTTMTESIIEASVVHSTANFTLSFDFGTQT
jgi:hypothetical protein